MSSRFPANALLIGLAAAALLSCDREERHSRSKPVGETVPAATSPDTIWPGGTLHHAPDPRAKVYDNNAPAISEGQFLYTRMNCVGCHSHGGGGMGPPLMDDQWRYGGRMDQIVASIAEGRPNGMPAWRGKLTEDQMWKLAAYVRSMSGQPSKDAVSRRAHPLSHTSPQTLVPREPQHESDSAQQ